ncbi:alpha-tocopherol transfer protein-like [Rhipicephalus microplus]|uniref:alpha-tocopherol transfer protein-like n=1 Tax=Rhipicephalus microplus TaxID=6941 RepID=UPI003F6AF9D3
MASSAGGTGGVFCALVPCRTFVWAPHVWCRIFGWAGHDTSARHGGTVEVNGGDEPELDAPIDSDFLLRFLRVRKFNVDAALQTIRKYYRVRTECGSVFLDFLPSKVSPEARALITVMPEKDVYGRRILYINVGEWTPEMTFSEFQKALMICVEHLASDPVTQTLGVVLLLDYDGFTIDKMLGVSIGRLKKILEYFQDCAPMRLKAVHILNQSYTFDFICGQFFLASLLSREKFKLHGENYQKLHEEISPSVLPEKYGGTGPPLDFEGFWRQLELDDKLFIANNQYGYSWTTAEDEFQTGT